MLLACLAKAVNNHRTTTRGSDQGTPWIWPARLARILSNARRAIESAGSRRRSERDSRPANTLGKHIADGGFLFCSTLDHPLDGIAFQDLGEGRNQSGGFRGISCMHILGQREHPFWTNVNSDSDGT